MPHPQPMASPSEPPIVTKLALLAGAATQAELAFEAALRSLADEEREIVLAWGKGRREEEDEAAQ